MMISFRKILLFLLMMTGYIMGIAQTPELVIQRGHRGPITDLVISDDGSFVLTGSPDRTLKLWEIKTGKEIRTFHEHSERTTEVFVDISTDNNYIISGSGTGTLKLWELETGNILRILQGEGEAINAVLFLPNTKLLLTGDAAGYINIWNLETLELEHKVQAHSGELTQFAVNEVGDLLLTAGEDGEIKVWQTKDWTLQQKMVGHTTVVTSIDFTKGGESVISGDKNGNVYLWDTDLNEVIFDFKEHTASITSVRFSPDGKRVITRSKDRVVKIWETATGIITDTQFLPFFRANDIEYDPQHNYIIGNYQSSLVIWDIEADGLVEKTVLSRGFFYKNPINDFQIGKKNNEILSVGNTALRYWGEASGKTIHTQQEIKKIAYSSNSNYIATIEDNEIIKVWDRVTGQLQMELNGHTKAVNSIDFSPDGQQLVSAGDDKELLLWNLEKQSIIRTYDGIKNKVTNVQFSADGQMILISDEKGIVQFWNVDNSELYHEFQAQEGTIHGFAVNEDVTLLATGSELGQINLWTLGQLEQELQQIKGHKGVVTSLDFNETSEQLLSTGDLSTKIWNVKAVRLVKDLRGHFEFIAKAKFSPKGNYMVSASYDQSLIFWDTHTWEKIAALHLVGKEDWIVIAENGLFDASSGGMEMMHYVINNEPIGLSQLKERYYEPNLLQKIIADKPFYDLRSTKPFYQVDLFPNIALELKESPTPTLTVRVTERSGGLGKVSVFVNNREIIEDLRVLGLTANNAKDGFSIDLDEYQTYFEPNTKNIIAVKAYNQGGWLSSRFKKIAYYASEYVATRPAPLAQEGAKKIVLNRFYKPHFYGIFIGTSDYRGEDMDLSFAAKDAYDISNAFQNIASNLFGAENTHIKLLSTDPTHNGTLPTKQNIELALHEFAAKATALDVFFIYLSGHGTNYGAENSQFYYLTKDLVSGDLRDVSVRNEYAISTNELTNWIKVIPAAKQIMVIDACHSGKFAEEVFGAARTNASNGDKRAFERMKDRTGIFILAGSAADMVSYEASQFGQGLLTYSLLLGLNGSALRDGGYVDVMRLFQYAADKVPEFAQYIGGIQRPIITAPKGSNSFDVGRVNETTEIPLAEIKPIFVRSSFQEENSYADLFNLSDLIDQRLIDVAGEGESASIIFADVPDHFNAYSIKGRYRLEGDKLQIEGKLFKGGAMVSPFRINGSKSNMNVTVTMIMDAVQRVLDE